MLGGLIDQILGQGLEQTAAVPETHHWINRAGLGLLKLICRQVGKLIDRVVPGLVARQVGRVCVLDHSLVLFEDLFAEDFLGDVVGREDMEDLLEVVLVNRVEGVEVAGGQVEPGGHGSEEGEKAKTGH